jgi:hypothetical protein
MSREGTCIVHRGDDGFLESWEFDPPDTETILMTREALDGLLTNTLRLASARLMLKSVLELINEERP